MRWRCSGAVPLPLPLPAAREQGRGLWPGCLVPTGRAGSAPQLPLLLGCSSFQLGPQRMYCRRHGYLRPSKAPERCYERACCCQFWAEVNVPPLGQALSFTAAASARGEEASEWLKDSEMPQGSVSGSAASESWARSTVQGCMVFLLVATPEHLHVKLAFLSR